MANENFFDDAAAAESETPEDSGAETQGEETNGQTSILPKDFFGPDAQVGDTHSVKIVSIHDDAIEVQAVSGETEEAGEGEESMAPPGDMEMQSMMSD